MAIYKIGIIARFDGLRHEFVPDESKMTALHAARLAELFAVLGMGYIQGGVDSGLVGAFIKDHGLQVHFREITS